MGSSQSRPIVPTWTRNDTTKYMQLYDLAPADQKDAILVENLNIALQTARDIAESIRNDPVVRKNVRASLMKMIGGAAENDKFGGESDSNRIGAASDSNRIGGASDSNRIGGASDSNRIGGASDSNKIGGAPNLKDVAASLKSIDLSEIGKLLTSAKDAGLSGVGDIVAKAEPEVALIDAITRIIVGVIDASGRFVAAATPFLQTLTPEVKRELMRNLFVQCQILYEWWKDQERLFYEPIFTLFDAYGPVVKELAEIQRKMIANPEFAEEYGGKWIDVAVDLYAKSHSAMNKIRKIRGSGSTENVGMIFAAKYALMIVFVIFLTILVIWVWRGEYQKNEISSPLDKMLLGSAFVGFFLTMI